MEEKETQDQSHRIIMVLDEEHMNMLRAIAGVTGYDGGSIIVTGLALYKRLLDAKQKKSRILIEDRNGDQVQILLT